MSDIRIRREHQLGLEQARRVASQWARQAQEAFDMDCQVVAGQTSDIVHFRRTGASGTLLVAADHFELQAKLGFLLGPFRRTIETEIQKNLDSLLASPPGC